MIEALTGQGVDGLGERLLGTILGALSGPDGTGGPAVALLRSAAENEAAARMLREFITRQVHARIAAALDLPDPQILRRSDQVREARAVMSRSR
ncbi:MAG: hypothetical protein ACRD0J_11675 [Acidimicrobiales bacterium]